MELEKRMDLETALYAIAWIGGFIILLLRFGHLYRD
jgi:hypothetical protein